MKPVVKCMDDSMKTFVELTSEADLEEAFHVIKELNPSIKFRSFMDSYSHPWSMNRHLYGIRQNRELISVADVWFLITGCNEKIFWINAFITKNGFRSKGYGKFLNDKLLGMAIKMNCKEIRVHAHRKSAQKYWTKERGFSEFSTIYRKENIT